MKMKTKVQFKNQLVREQIKIVITSETHGSVDYHHIYREQTVGKNQIENRTRVELLNSNVSHSP